MPLVLAKQNTNLTELMDDPDCDVELLNRTYSQFRWTNILFSGWRTIYKTYLRPRMQSEKRPYTILDIGFGGGDIPLQIAKWALADNLEVELTGIEIDQRALDYVNSLNLPSNVSFRLATPANLLDENQRYDFIINNNTLHHLNQPQLDEILRDVRGLCKSLVIFNDIERGDLAWLSFGMISKLLFHRSFISYDGRLSIRRSFTKRELKNRIPPDWSIQRLFPYRLLLMYAPQ